MMLTKWFGTRSPRSSQRARFVRPSLECLEGRLAPSGLMPMDDNNQGDEDGHDHDHGPPGHQGPPPASVSAGSTISTDANHSFNNSTITNSFNNTVTINNTFMLMPAQQGAVSELSMFGTLLGSALSSPQLGSLINNEIALAVDKYLDAFPMIANSALGTSLTNDISKLQSAINQNPLVSSPVGQMIGMLAFTATTNALTSAQPTI